MARPTVIRNEVILDAARAVFLERGILATSAEVAQRAGVSEGSIFKRFKTKSELFRAAMGVDVEDVLPLLRDLLARAGERTVEQNLTDVALDMVVIFERVLPIMMMSWSNPKVGCPHANSADPAPLRAQRYLAEYFDAEARIGRIGPVHGEVMARAFLGALRAHVFMELLASNAGTSPIDRELFVRDFVHTLVLGMERVTAVRAPSSRPRAIEEIPPAKASGF